MAVAKLKQVVNRLVNLSVYAFFCTTLLTACSSDPQPQVQAKPEPMPVYKVKASKTPKNSSAFFIEKAQQAPAQQARSLHIKAVNYAIKELRPLDYINSILGQINPNKYGSLQDDIDLAKAYLYTEQLDNAELIVSRLKGGALPKEYQKDLWVVSAQLESTKLEHVKAVRSVFRILAFYSSQLQSTDKVVLNQITWRHILKVPPATLESFENDFGPQAQVWISLAKIVKYNLTDPITLTTELSRWQRNNISFVKTQPLPTGLTDLLNVRPFKPKRIALLLPITGSLAEQAKVIRNGFISAMEMDSTTELTIIDTATHDMETIAQKLAQSNVEFVVGPLTKEKVEQYTQSDMAQLYPSLLLNMPTTSLYSAATSNNFFFSLSPEDEINQAITFFINRGVKHPALIYADNSLGRRLSEHFEQQWLSQTEQKLETIAFKNKSKLGDAVKDLLDVTSSNKRIKEMKRLFGPNLETEPRSRKDIDAVYVIANSQQTRLIKPFFDVNISTFGERLPIYASSRSYLEGETTAQKRDLNGLLFTEMPWLIKNTDSELNTVYRQLGNHQTQMKKLFAFGYDAHNLIHMVQQLKVLANYQVEALTGKLSLTPEDNIIKRELTWSKYQQGKVVEIVSDL